MGAFSYALPHIADSPEAKPSLKVRILRMVGKCLNIARLTDTGLLLRGMKPLDGQE